MCAKKTTILSGTCPEEKRLSISCTAAIISSKWMPEIILALSYGVLRFGGLRKATGGVNPRTLSARLDELEEAGIITKTAYAEVPPRIEYMLTEKGQDLAPILERMIEWGNKYSKKSEKSAP